MSRRHVELKSLLPDYRGTLQGDGYQAYASLASAAKEVEYVGCWAHARRPFHEALKESPVAAAHVLRLIGHLYRCERQWKERGLTGPALRAALRASHFGLTLQLLKRTVTKLAQRARPRSQLGQACSYLLNQWEPLAAHSRLGHTEIDNNLIENAIRPSAVGKKNWLFIGHPEAGDRSAVLYTIIASCRRHGGTRTGSALTFCCESSFIIMQMPRGLPFEGSRQPRHHRGRRHVQAIADRRFPGDENIEILSLTRWRFLTPVGGFPYPHNE